MLSYVEFPFDLSGARSDTYFYATDLASDEVNDGAADVSLDRERASEDAAAYLPDPFVDRLRPRLDVGVLGSRPGPLAPQFVVPSMIIGRHRRTGASQGRPAWGPLPRRSSERGRSAGSRSSGPRRRPQRPAPCAQPSSARCRDPPLS